VCHAKRLPTNFHTLLERIDADLADQVRLAGCRHCGGVLHRANYPRKPFGVKRFSSSYQQRFSLCCGRDGCRRRSTPPSLRFLGRVRYVGALMLLLSALSQGVTARRGERLRAVIGVSRRTITRWRRWWREVFVTTPTGKALFARMPGLREAGALPGVLLAAFDGTTMRQRLLQCLAALTPLSIDRADYPLAEVDPQTLSVLSGEGRF
jgi:hypothetical protein